MRRKAIVALLAAFLTTGVALAQELEVSGEIKTGFYLQHEKTGDLEPTNYGGMRNNDGDSGAGEGRVRLNFHAALENVGLRVRFQIDPAGPASPRSTWNFAYAYGNLFDNQFTVSAGILGESPWGTGGPELLREPESAESQIRNAFTGEIDTVIEGLMGIRFEFKPSFIPGLNLGFILNRPDKNEVKSNSEQTFGELMGESVVGIAYENPYFAARVGYRLDGEMDNWATRNINEGGRLTYRLEERFLATRAEGMQVWLNGYYYGLGAEREEQVVVVNGERLSAPMSAGEYLINWVYWLWDTDNFTAKFDACFAMYQMYFNREVAHRQFRQEYQSLEFRPAFYYKFFDGLLLAGVGVGFGMEFGPGKTYADAFYQYYSVEPQIKLNLSANAYLALVYNFTESYAGPDSNNGYDYEKIRLGDKTQKHWVNLRAVYAF